MSEKDKRINELELTITNLIKDKRIREEELKNRELEVRVKLNKLNEKIEEYEKAIKRTNELIQNSPSLSLSRNQVIEKSILFMESISLKKDVALKALSDIKKNLADTEKMLLDEKVILESNYSKSKESLVNLTVNSEYDDLKVVDNLKEYYFSISHLKTIGDILRAVDNKKKELQDYVNQFL